MRYAIGKISICATLCLGTFGCGGAASKPVALPPLQAMAPPGSVGPTIPEYRLQPGDTLRIKFLYHPELDIKVPIRPDGNVTLQLAGDVHAAGLRPAELEQLIKERTSDRLRDPEVSVIVAQLADVRVYVGGEVKLPGYVAYHPGMSVLQAIMDRGGFTDTAQINSVLRVSSAGEDLRGTRLDLTKPLSEGTDEDVRLIAGDVLYVPRTFIGDVNSFVKLYIRGILPTEPRVGAGTAF